MPDQTELHIDDRPLGRVATLVIANLRRLNTLNGALMQELVDRLHGLAADPALRALVLTGAGDRAFVGGADIDEMAALRSPADARAFIGRVHACCHAVRAVPVPVFARIQGYCFGAGLELAASCDLRAAADTALFGMPEVKLGIPSVVEAALLPGLVGWGRTRQMLLLGESFTAHEAEAWRLVEACVPPGQLDATVEGWVAQTLTATPRAVRLQKALIRQWEDLPLAAAVQAGIDSFAAAYETDEPGRAMQAFRETQRRSRAGVARQK